VGTGHPRNRDTPSDLVTSSNRNSMVNGWMAFSSMATPLRSSMEAIQLKKIETLLDSGPHPKIVGCGMGHMGAQLCIVDNCPNNRFYTW